jgi:hypothetical protein
MSLAYFIGKQAKCKVKLPTPDLLETVDLVISQSFNCLTVNFPGLCWPYFCRLEYVDTKDTSVKHQLVHNLSTVNLIVMPEAYVLVINN